MAEPLAYGYGRPVPSVTTGDFTALIDIMMATIGIFVIVFALQEIVEHEANDPKPYDLAIFCTNDAGVSVHLRDGVSETLAVDAMAAGVERMLPEGGDMFLGLGAACPQKTMVALIQALEGLGRVDPDAPSNVHRYEMGPLGADAFGPEGLLSSWRMTDGQGQP